MRTLLPTGLARLTNWQTWGGPGWGGRVGCTIKPGRENTDREALMKPIPAALLPNRNELSVTQSLFERREMMCSLFPNQFFLTAPGLIHCLASAPGPPSCCVQVSGLPREAGGELLTQEPSLILEKCPHSGQGNHSKPGVFTGSMHRSEERGNALSGDSPRLHPGQSLEKRCTIETKPRCLHSA